MISPYDNKKLYSDELGFFSTPNVNIPLNKREKGEVASVAIEQLRRFLNAADTWPVQGQRRDNRDCKVCRVCGQCLWFVTDRQGNQFGYSTEEKRSLITAHIRQCHEALISEKGEVNDGEQ